MSIEPYISLDFSCVYYGIWNGALRDQCPNKKDGDKQCVRLGKMCKYLNGEQNVHINVKRSD